MYKENIIALEKYKKKTLLNTGVSLYSYDETNNEFIITSMANSSGYLQLGGAPQIGDVVTEQNFNTRYIYVAVQEGKDYTILKKTGEIKSVYYSFLDDTKTGIARSSSNLMSFTVTAPTDAKWLLMSLITTTATASTTYRESICVRVDGSTEWTNPITPQKTTYTLTLRGIPVSSGGNYTDNNNQQWLCDTIERYKDGSGKYIQRVFKADSSYYKTGFNKAGTTTTNIFIKYNNYTDILKPKASTRALCSYFGYQASYGTDMPSAFAIDNIGITRFRTYFNMGASGVDNVADFEEWIADKDVYVIYALETPIETPLTALQLSQLNLSTYYPITNISSESGVMVEYICDTKNYIDNKFLQTN